MNASPAAAIPAAIFRAIAALLGAVVLCACVLGAIGFVLVALYTYLAPALGPTPAAFATSGAALIVPSLVTAGIVVATRMSADDRLPIPARTWIPTAKAAHVQAAPALDWLTKNPSAADLGAELRKSLVQGFKQATVP
jgi:hypothetical protein